MRAGKIIAHHRHGQGKLSVHRMTVIRAGGVGETGASKAVADMFVDPFPIVSLRGVDVGREYDRRGNTMKAHDESHIQARTRGKSSSRGIQANDGKLVTKE